MSNQQWSPSEVGRAGALDLAPYLASTGWARERETASFTLWSRNGPGGQRLQVVVPLDRTAGDAKDRIVEAVDVIAYAQQMTVAETLADIEAGGADVVSVRISPSTPSGVAPLDVAERSVSALKDWVIGAGGGVAIGGAVLPSRRPRAERYAARARLTTQPGSFILTVTMPLYEGRPATDTETGQMALEDVVEMEAPSAFGRDVASRMRDVASSAVALAREVHENRDDITAFDTDPDRTGNATELKALGRLGGGLTQPVQLRFITSPVLPAEPTEPIIVTIGQREQAILADAGELLTELKPKDDVTVAGNVVALRRDEGLGPGEVVIRAVEIGTGRWHRYRVLLSEDQYRQAIAAHERHLLVTARGELAVHGNFLILEQLRSFTVQQELPQPE